MATSDIVEPTKRDILCGRGHISHNHAGNEHFRMSITMYLPKYANNNTSRKEKTAIVKNILEELRRDQRRFLKESAKGWFEIGSDEAKKKVGHAIRDATFKMEHSLKRGQQSILQNKVEKKAYSVSEESEVTCQEGATVPSSRLSINQVAANIAAHIVEFAFHCNMEELNDAPIETSCK